MQNIDNYNFKGRKALIRVDFNVPLDKDFQITDPTRIIAALPTIKKILGDGGAVILMSHLGRPKEGPEDKFSLRHLLPYLSEQLGRKISFADDCIGASAEQKSAALDEGDVLLLENLRFYKEETKGDKGFAANLARHGDVYVNDAFGTAHRAHASTAIIAEFFPEEKMFGYLMSKEVESISKVLDNPPRPFTAIIGGAKVSGKIEIIENLLDKVDQLIIGGGMMFTFIKAMGGHIGKSLVEEDLLDTARKLMIKANEKNVELYIPIDTRIADDFKEDAANKVCLADEVPDTWMGLDIGPKTIKIYEEAIKKSASILWNGPMGVFEMEAFSKGTKKIALSVAEATKNGSFSLIGGGDSVAAINKYHLKDKVSYVSTGGGAMLEFIEGKELPGVKAIKQG